MLGNVFEQPLHLGAAHFLVGHLPAAVEDHRLDLVAFAEEPDDLVLAHLVIVLRSGRAELHFLELRALLVLALLVLLLVQLVEEAAIVRDLANGRVGGRRNLHQVQSPFARHADGLEGLHHTHLPAILVYYANFASADSVIDSRALVRSKTPLGDKSTSGPGLR